MPTEPPVSAIVSAWLGLTCRPLSGGFTPDEAGKIAGGNYLRIFRAAVG